MRVQVTPLCIHRTSVHHTNPEISNKRETAYSLSVDPQPHALDLIVSLHLVSRRHLDFSIHIHARLRHRPPEIQLASQPPGLGQVEIFLNPCIEVGIVVVVLKITAEALERQGGPEEELMPRVRRKVSGR